ncbi:MAG TPA: hypothetical protein VE379_04320, partial [Vicinamibacterales bacterium]|nr:hypothetical protein [Vicinamibacterales bacterium]
MTAGRPLRFLLGAAAAGALALTAAAQPPRYDLIVRGGGVIDGTGGPWYRADLAISGDAIAAIGPTIDGAAG